MSTEGTHAHASRGTVDARGVRVAVIAARFNADVTDRLVDGALRCLMDHGGLSEDVSVYRVPGAWELPQAAARVLAMGAHDCVVTLGCVIRGETPHFEYVCSEATRGLGAVAREASVPVVFGVLTTDTHAQAMARAGEGVQNKGYEATLSALQMVDLFRELDAP
ncbi:MAG: 6,7-dimethyl-8-ribityllumazine synthase [Gemmatimonadota bacterium]